MGRVFTAIERAALPKRVVYSDFAATTAMIPCEVGERRRWQPGPKTSAASFITAIAIQFLVHTREYEEVRIAIDEG
jgi:hypothetical protein